MPVIHKFMQEFVRGDWDKFTLIFSEGESVSLKFHGI